MKIAEALLLRKQLQQKVDQLRPLRMQGDQGLFELQTKRMQKSETVDEVSLQIPKITLSEVTAQFDHYATELRKLDASIQKANWAFDVDYKETKAPKEPKK